MKKLLLPNVGFKSLKKMEKKKILEIFEPLSDDQTKLILGGSENPDCQFYDVCTSTAYCTEKEDCGNGEWLMSCEDQNGCWDCRATIAG